ncbi:MAG TPA: AMP-binding protein, partial [Lacipirellulaceae bacterium]|nr:AMP-binding protein [Lacipirellulaceae bacterium]
ARPVATIEAQEILGETAAATSKGAGVCVGRKFGAIEWRVIQITDEPIANIAEAEELPAGEIGELIVRGPQVSHSYLPVPSPGHSSRERKPDEFGAANRRAKIRDGAAVWHRMGDVGYLDDRGRFWYCGRKSHRVETASGPLFSANIEGVFDRLPGVRRSALVYVNADQHPHDQLPVMVIELNAEWKATGPQERDSLIGKWYDLEPRLETLWYAPKGYVPLRAILFHPSLPVDVRHNSKINREALATWAAMQLCADNQAPR